jgi:2-polyprenyl-6-methoxyphenol hydroxylase-like FAD-dependent oxidoreductase
MRTSTDVLVVGGGPVGLLLAGELQRRGVDHLLIEAKKEPVYFCKALGVSPRTLEVFDQIGVLDEALDRGLWLRGQVAAVNGADIRRSDFPSQESRYFTLVLAQYDTEDILRGLLRGVGGRVEAGVILRSLEIGADRVVAHVSANGGERTIECRYLVGCDGARSAVRHGLQMDYEGDAYPMTFMLGDVLVHWEQPRGYAYRLTQTEDGALRNVVVAIPIPGDPRRYRLSMAAPEKYWDEGADLSHAPTLDEIIATSASALPPGTRLTDLRWSSLYRISHRIVPQYRSGLVFLAGDAAHIHPPIGGQGMNTGLQDAHNLGWKLAFVIGGLATPALLDSYHDERHPVGMDVVSRTSRRMDEAVTEGTADWAEELRVDSQLFVHYRDAANVGEDVDTPEALASGPRPGDLAPDATGLQRPVTGRPARLKALLRHLGFTVLCYVGDDDTAEDWRHLAEIADMLAASYPRAVAMYGIVAPDTTPRDAERFPVLVDADGTFRSAYGGVRSSLYLVRPDGYAGYRARPAQRQTLERHLQRVLGAAPTS